MSMVTDILCEKVPQNLKYLKQENKIGFSWWFLMTVAVQKLTLSSILLNTNVTWLFQQEKNDNFIWGS